MKKIGFFLGSVVFLSACSQFASNGDKQYIQAKNGAKIAVLPPLSESNISHFYDLPPQNQNSVVNIKPPVAKKTPR